MITSLPLVDPAGATAPALRPAAPEPQSAVAASGLRRIGRLDVAAITGDEALAIIELSIEARSELHVAFVNAHCVNVAAGDERYAATMRNFLSLPDGIGVDLGSRMLFGEPFPENLNGTDFVPFVLERAARDLRVALIGGEPGIVETAAERLAERFPRHRFLPIQHGYFSAGEATEAVLALLRLVQADIVLVGLGVPRQENFIAETITAREVPVAIAVGAFLDFSAGKVPRAPPAVRRMRSEWLWRLALEPRRLAQRYVAGNPAFLLRMARQWLGRRPSGDDASP